MNIVLFYYFRCCADSEVIGTAGFNGTLGRNAITCHGNTLLSSEATHAITSDKIFECSHGEIVKAPINVPEIESNMGDPPKTQLTIDGNGTLSVQPAYTFRASDQRIESFPDYNDSTQYCVCILFNHS